MDTAKTRSKLLPWGWPSPVEVLPQSVEHSKNGRLSPSDYSLKSVISQTIVTG